MNTFSLQLSFTSDLEQAALCVVTKLQSQGHQALFVGGYVRDALLGMKTHDIDIVTSALPEQVMRVCDDYKDYGKKFGVLLVKQNGYRFDVATMRIEGAYTDGRRPVDVVFTKDITQDAARRDFTINAVYYDPVQNTGYDFFSGRDDLQAKRLRFIGNNIDDQHSCAVQRIVHEDHLRLLRAIRFSAVYGCVIDQAARHVMKDAAHLLEQVAVERVREELDKMINKIGTAKTAQALREFGLEQLLSR